MDKNVYSVWLDDEKMKRYRLEYIKENKAKIFFISLCFVFLASLALFLVTLLFLNSYFYFIPKISSLHLFLYIFAFFSLFYSVACIFKHDIREEMIDDALSRLNYYRFSSHHSDWTLEHDPKEFGAYFIKQAEKAGIDTKQALEAIKRFLLYNVTSYNEFYFYCIFWQKRWSEKQIIKAKKEQEQQKEHQKLHIIASLEKEFVESPTK